MDALSTNTARIIVNLWKSGMKSIHIKDVYDRLVSESETIKDRDMQNIFNSLLKSDIHSSTLSYAFRRNKIHSALRITCVNPVLIKLFYS